MRLFAFAQLGMQALSSGIHKHSTPSILAAACRVRLANRCCAPSSINRRYSIIVESTMSLNKRIGFMGSGQMAEALARGLIDRGVVQASQICCSDPAPARKELFRSLGCTPYDTNFEVGLTQQTAVAEAAAAVQRCRQTGADILHSPLGSTAVPNSFTATFVALQRQKDPLHNVQCQCVTASSATTCACHCCTHPATSPLLLHSLPRSLLPLSQNKTRQHT